MLSFINFNLIVWILFASHSVHAYTSNSIEQDLSQLQSQWAKGTYVVESNAKENFFSILFNQSKQLLENHPQNAELHIWHGIIAGSYAKAKGGLKALGLAKTAKASFEKAIKLNPRALGGSAYTSLGVLYDKVPGWPIGFGDTKKAKRLLETALSMAPDDIDNNYFYGMYLIDHGETKKGVRRLSKALQAPARIGRDLADSGRRSEINQILANIH